jgi:hypothetical protein
MLLYSPLHPPDAPRCPASRGAERSGDAPRISECRNWRWIGSAAGRTVTSMLTTIVILLVVWAILAIVGFAIKGLVWLAIIGIVLFIGTLVLGLVRRSARKKKSV